MKYFKANNFRGKYNTRGLTVLSFFLACIFFSAPVIAQEKPVQAEPKKDDKKWYDTFSLSGMIRIRPEIKSNVGFKDGESNTYEFIGQKAWISMLANPLEKLKAVLTIQDSRLWGGENNALTGISTSAENSQSLDFREAYIDLAALQDSSLHIVLGRQKIVFGDQRMFGALEWSNSGRSFDAVKIKWDEGINSLNVWSSLLAESNALDSPQISAYQGQPERFFSGIYNSTKFADWLLVDVYYANKVIPNDSLTLNHHTAGARITDRTADGKTVNDFPLDFTAEAAYQFGSNTSKSVSAYAGALVLGYTIDAGVKIRIGLEGDIASGDTDSKDKIIGTFDNLFPTNHGFYGQADVISWQNMVAFSGNINLWFAREFSLNLAYWYFSKLTNKDKWYAVTGGSNTNETWITGTSGVSESLFLAHEADFIIKSEISKNFSLESGYSFVLPGAAPLDAGKDKIYHFAYISAQAKF